LQPVLDKLLNLPPPLVNIMNVPGKGDCFFIALSCILHPEQDSRANAALLRTRVIDFIANIPKDHSIRSSNIWPSLLVYTSPEQIAILRQPCQWDQDLMDLVPDITAHLLGFVLVLLRQFMPPVICGTHYYGGIQYIFHEPASSHYSVITSFNVAKAISSPLHVIKGSTTGFSAAIKRAEPLPQRIDVDLPEPIIKRHRAIIRPQE
jgi:hypothetical protein